MKLTEFKYLVDNGYITQVQYAGHYLDPANSKDLEALTEEELIKQNIITRVGYIAEAHTFEIELVGKVENPIITINSEQRSIGIFSHDSDIVWSVNAKGYKEKTGKYKLVDDHIEKVTLEPAEVKVVEKPVTASTSEITPEEAKSKTKKSTVKK